MRKLTVSSTLIVFALLVAMALVTPASASLPPRPTAAPPRIVGGWIELRAQNGKAQWTLVQWQDSAGNWVNVEAWRGAFDAVTNGVGVKTWWVDQALFGATPYRWVVYDPTNNQVVAASAPFNLPIENKQTVSTALTLTP